MAHERDGEAVVASTGRRRGRPPGSKRGTFTFRVTAALREKLEAEAIKSGRPVSEEIEMRLERSFLHDEMRMIVREELSRGDRNG